MQTTDNQNPLKISLIRATPDRKAHTPIYATEQAAGADLCASLQEPVVLLPMQRMLIPTGIILEIPAGYEVQIRPRSGLAFKEGITVCNAPGTIDSDYRGEIKVLLIHLGDKPFVIEDGMRIAQMCVAPSYRAEFVHKEKVEAVTERNEGGFGHTGIHSLAGAGP